MEALQYTIVALLAIALAINIPRLQMSLVLVPAVYTALTHRNGLLFSIMSFVFVSGVVWFTSGAFAMVVFVAILCTMGILVGEISYRKHDMMLAIMLGALVVIANFVLLIVIERNALGIDPVEYLLNGYFQMLKENRIGELVNYDLLELKNMLRISMPGIVIAMGILMGVINYFSAGRILQRAEYGKPIFRYFWEFSLPGSALVAALLTILGVGIADTMTGYSADVMLSNLRVVYSTLFLVQGLALVDYFLLRRLRFPIRITLLILAGATVVTAPFLVTMGALDLVFNIRRLDRFQ